MDERQIETHTVVGIYPGYAFKRFHQADVCYFVADKLDNAGLFSIADVYPDYRDFILGEGKSGGLYIQVGFDAGLQSISLTALIMLYYTIKQADLNAA